MSRRQRPGKRIKELAVLAVACILLPEGSLAGQKQAKPEGGVATGYFFYLGRYIPPPYRVAVEGYRVLVNGEFPTTTMDEPPMPLPIPGDPGEFDWTPEKLKKPFDDVGIHRHAGNKAAYWAFKYGPERAWQMMIEYLRAQPGVKEVREMKEMGEDTIMIIGASGGSIIMGPSPGGIKGWAEKLKRSYTSSEAEAKQIQEQAIAERRKQLENHRASVEQGFLRGDLLFVIREGGGVTMSAGGHVARDRLMELRAALKSGRDDAEKREALKKLVGNPELLDQLIENQNGPWPALEPQ